MRLSGTGQGAIAAMSQRPIRLAALFCCFLLLSCSLFAQGIAQTLAGGGAPGFCGERTPAVSACLQSPVGITFDPAGNRYVADTANHRVRVITAGGIIITMAGTGTAGFSGDNGASNRASLREPTGVAFDVNNGDLYVLDAGNNRIRRITAAGIITTIVGDGTAGFSGDRGPAGSARINTAGTRAGIFLGPGGLYITDTGNSRIRRIDSTGTIVTVAGSASTGYGGDNFSATAALLNRPTGAVAVDSNTNIYFADTGNSRVRRVSPLGIITTVAGTQLSGFANDGGPATSALLNRPEGVAVDRLGQLFIADTGNNRIRQVAPNGVITTMAGGGSLATGEDEVSTNLLLREPTGIAADRHVLLVVNTASSRVLRIFGAYARPGLVSVNPNRLEFRAFLGGENPDPAGLLLGSPDLIEFGFSARVASSSGNWLSLRPLAGYTPVSFRVGVDIAGLAAGDHDGSITFTLPRATNSPITMPVRLTIVNLPPALAVRPDQLFFSAVQGVNPPGQVIRISNDGGGALAWTAVVAQIGPRQADWLRLASNAGIGSTPLGVTVNSAALAPGSYQSGIIVGSSTREIRRIPVSLQVTAATAVLQTSQSGLIFTAVEGSGSIPTRNFNVINAGSGTLNWTAEIRAISGGNWLSVAPASGMSTAAQAPPQVVFTANATGLRAGAYTALVRVSATGAAGSPQFVNTVLNVLPPGATPPPQPSPSGLLFLASVGGARPASQVVRVFAGGAAAVSFQASTTEIDSQDWLDVDPAGGTASATTPTVMNVSVDQSGLQAGSYRGTVNVALTDGSTRSVNVLLVVAAAGTTFSQDTSAAPEPGGHSAAAGRQPAAAAPGGQPALVAADCTPTRLAAVHTALVSNFSSPVGWPIPLVVRVTDDCGGTQTTAAVVTTFSNGDSAISMANLRNGQYSGTWTPSSSASAVTINSSAVVSGLAPATAQISGGIGANNVPLVYRGGAVHAASYARGAPLGPGSIFSVFGSNLAPAQFFASAIPLPRELGGLSATMGNFDVPLYFSSTGQVNAQVPFDLPINSNTQLVIKIGNAYTVPENISIAAVQPGIFTLNQSGTGPGAILDAQGAPNSAANPARPGAVIQIFATGFGETTPRVPAGDRSPSSPPATVVRIVTATVDGINAPVHFAGLAPTFVGLYQVNVQIPAGVRAGEVNLLLTQDGAESNIVTVFVQP